ncbi:hypothetical protein R3W88_029201 [Solanum pinnatisectum]|uniref:Uncharacterized protein n=1 Tax=Solanum pinnatisectum TaxID=50273 RepID=A0AAV9K514_9SOLN|nr:hypothetical protein R3W88_029201 [Solanum pinnatisectum]
MTFRNSSDFSYKDSTDVISADLSHVCPITRRKFKNSGLDESVYFTSLEVMKDNNSHMMVVSATPKGNLASVLFGEFSQIGSNFSESEDSMDSPTSMNVNALMADSTDMDKKFAMMEQTIKALKKSVDDKNLHIAQFMNKLEAFRPGESSHVSTRPSASNQKKCSRSQIMPNTISLQFRSFTPVEVDFPRKNPEGSLEIDDNEVDGWTLVTHKKWRHQAVLRIRLPKTRATRSDVNQLQSSKSVKSCTSQKINGSSLQKVRRPITLDELFPEKFFCGSQIGATHVISSTDETKGSKEADLINLKDSKVQWAAIKISKKRTEEVSIMPSPSKGYMQTSIDNEQPIFCYILCELHPPRKELSHITFHDLKEKMIVLVAQVPSITLEPSKGNIHVGKIKGNFDQKVFTLLEKSGYDFSNPEKLGELRDEVTGEKIHGLTKSQMKLRKQGYHVATPKFGLGFSLPEPLRISSKKGKEITSCYYIFIEKTKEIKEGKTPRRTWVFGLIGRLTPRVSVFERLCLKDKRESSKQVDEYVTTSTTSVFHRLGTKRKSLFERKLLEHENQDSSDVIDEKEIHSVFPSRMNRKSVLSITTDGSLKLKKKKHNCCHQPISWRN